MNTFRNQRVLISFLLYIYLINAAHSFETLLDQFKSNKNWVSRRDFGLIKQTFDSSCGAASLINILNNYYGLKLNEIQVLAAMRFDRPKLYSLKDLGNAIV